YSSVSSLHCVYSNDLASTTIYTLSLTTLFRSYSQEEIGGSPTGPCLLSGSPNCSATLALVTPVRGLTISACWPTGTRTVSAEAGRWIRAVQARRMIRDIFFIGLSCLVLLFKSTLIGHLRAHDLLAYQWLC